MRALRRVRAGARAGHPGGVRAGSILIAAAVGGVLVTLPAIGDYTLYVLGLVVIQAIAVLSLNLLMGYAGQVSLGQSALVGVGAFAVGELAQAGIPFPLTIPVAALATAVIATVVGLPSLRIRGFQIAATTLAFGIVAERFLFSRPWDSEAGTGIAVVRPSVIVGGRAFLILALVGLAVVLALDTAIRRSKIGRAFRAVRDREDTAAARGISVGRTKLLAYALSGLYAGIAGALFAYLLERATADSFTVFTSLGLVAAVVVGGLGSWRGAIVAGVVFAGLPELLRPIAGYAPFAGAVLLVLVPVIRPEGLGWLLDRPVRLPSRRKRTIAAVQPVAEAERALAQPVRPLSLSMPVRTLLVAEDVAVSFGGLQALGGVTFEARRGEIVGLIGPNGAGKSTFLNVLSGVVRPDRGRIAYRGQDLTHLPADARAPLGIARTFQQVGVSTRLTVRENVLAAQHVLARYGVAQALVRAPGVGATERALAQRAEAAIEILGLTDAADVPVGSLSHGDQRHAEVAAAIASGPELLLLDEPFAGTGHEGSEELARRLMELRDVLGLTIVVIEHDVPLVGRLSDHVYVLDQGIVLAEGAPEDIQRHPDVISVYLGEPVARAEAV